jgi:hypothetical protein
MRVSKSIITSSHERKTYGVGDSKSLREFSLSEALMFYFLLLLIIISRQILGLFDSFKNLNGTFNTNFANPVLHIFFHELLLPHFGFQVATIE